LKRTKRTVKNKGSRIDELEGKLDRLHALLYHRIDLDSWEAAKAVRERDYEAFRRSLKALKGDLKEAEELGEALKEAARLEVGGRSGVKA